MSRRTITAGLIAVLIGGGGLATVTIQRAAAANAAPAPFQYSIKYVCGDFGKTVNPNAPEDPEGPVKPGDYQTLINVHNPNSTMAQFQKRAVLVFTGTGPVPETQFEQPMPPGQIVTPPPLPPDFGMSIDCQDMRKVLLPGAPAAPAFIDGWVVLSSPVALDVEAVYTAHTFNLPSSLGTGFTREGFSIAFERVQPTARTR